VSRAPAAGGLALAAVSAAALGAAWGVLVEPRWLDVRHKRAAIPNLPPAWHGKRLALFADIQVGARFSGSAVATTRRLVQRIVAERPALALIAGDLVYEAVLSPRRAIPVAVDLVRPLPRAGIPTYAVLGNHDHALETEQSQRAQAGIARTLSRALEAAGITVLENQSAPLPSPAGAAARPGEQPALYLVGVGDHMTGADDPRRALRQVPADAPRLVLVHDPASFPALPADSAPLALAGHTHGGQIRVPGRPTWTIARLPPMNRRWPDYCDGWIEGYGQPGNRLYVNRGVGFSYVPIRFGCRPELTFITLLPAERGRAQAAPRARRVLDRDSPVGASQSAPARRTSCR
jgi:uncharacterized protein